MKPKKQIAWRRRAAAAESLAALVARFKAWSESMQFIVGSCPQTTASSPHRTGLGASGAPVDLSPCSSQPLQEWLTKPLFSSGRSLPLKSVRV